MFFILSFENIAVDDKIAYIFSSRKIKSWKYDEIMINLAPKFFNLQLIDYLYCFFLLTLASVKKQAHAYFYKAFNLRLLICRIF